MRRINVVVCVLFVLTVFFSVALFSDIPQLQPIRDLFLGEKPPAVQPGLFEIEEGLQPPGGGYAETATDIALKLPEGWSATIVPGQIVDQVAEIKTAKGETLWLITGGGRVEVVDGKLVLPKGEFGSFGLFHTHTFGTADYSRPYRAKVTGKEGDTQSSGEYQIPTGVKEVTITAE